MVVLPVLSFLLAACCSAIIKGASSKVTSEFCRSRVCNLLPSFCQASKANRICVGDPSWTTSCPYPARSMHRLGKVLDSYSCNLRARSCFFPWHSSPSPPAHDKSVKSFIRFLLVDKVKANCSKVIPTDCAVEVRLRTATFDTDGGGIAREACA